MDHLPGGVLANIKLTQDMWINNTHVETTCTCVEREQSTEEYNVLKESINTFLGTVLGRNGGNVLLFNRPVNETELSNGQKNLLQFCLALHHQKAKLNNITSVDQWQSLRAASNVVNGEEVEMKETAVKRQAVYALIKFLQTSTEE